MWLTDRLKERSTWAAIAAIAGLFGMEIQPEFRDLIINALIGVAAVVAFMFDENKNVNINLPPIELQGKPTPHIVIPPGHRESPDLDDRSFNG
jgi:hypothetical protein